MILVTGATGLIGRKVIDMLLEKKQPVIAITRHPDTAKFPQDVRVVNADPSHPETLQSVLGEVDVMFLIPSAIESAAKELLDLASKAGVKRVVLISALTVQYGGGYRKFSDRFRAVEDAVKASGLPWTILRSADFDKNALAWASQIRSTGIVRGAYASAATSSIHERDLAGVGVEALMNENHVGQIYILTGPESLTQRAKAELIGKAIGKEVRFEEMPAEQIRQAMLAQGLPEDIPDRMLGYLADCVKNPGPTTDTVEKILSRPALTFAEWAVEHKEAFI